MSADLTHEKPNGERWVIKFQNYMNVCVATAYAIPKQGGFTFAAEKLSFEADSLPAAYEGIIAKLNALP
ncbi:MAG: hypothetical protein HYR55_01640 [Acidobacteria bacterium]|nr:hypothetical protein [Acidobacteriota bacterium]MBI3656342.1 hypothetical protein [Acidobacteriota bacterium]